MKQTQTQNLKGEKSIKILGFVCNWHSYGEADNFADKNYSAEVKLIRVMCAARVNRAILLKAAETNIDGIMVIMCKECDCRYKDGSYVAKTRITHTARLLNSLGFDKNRIKLIEIDDLNQDHKISEKISKFVSEINSF